MNRAMIDREFTNEPVLANYVGIDFRTVDMHVRAGREG